MNIIIRGKRFSIPTHLNSKYDLFFELQVGNYSEVIRFC